MIKYATSTNTYSFQRENVYIISFKIFWDGQFSGIIKYIC